MLPRLPLVGGGGFVVCGTGDRRARVDDAVENGRIFARNDEARWLPRNSPVNSCLTLSLTLQRRLYSTWRLPIQSRRHWPDTAYLLERLLNEPAINVATLHFPTLQPLYGVQRPNTSCKKTLTMKFSSPMS